MEPGAIVAAGLGGLGLFLLGSWLAGCGLGQVLAGPLRKRGAHWTGSAKGAYLTGLALTVMLGWNSSLSASVATLSRRWRLPTRRGSLLLAGSACALGLVPLMAWLDGLGWFVRCLAFVAIGGGVLLRIARPALASLGEGLAGHGLVLLGVGLLGDGLRELALGLQLPEVRGNPIAAVLFIAAGAGLGIGLRSPCAAVLISVQSAAAGFASVHTAAALLVGAGMSLPLLTARAGRQGDADDGALAAVHGSLGAALALVSGLLLFWSIRFPALLEGVPGGTYAALAAFQLVGLAAASLIFLAGSDALGSFVQHRLNASRPASRIPYTPGPLQQTVPALALESLGASIDTVLDELRKIAHARLHGTRVSQARRDHAREVTAQITSHLMAFGRELGSVRWTGPEVASALGAVRSSEACARLIDQLETLPAPAGGADPDSRMESSVASIRVWSLIEAATRADELPLLRDFRALKDMLDLELMELQLSARSQQNETAAEHAGCLRIMLSTTGELAEARSLEVSFEPCSEGDERVGAGAEPAANESEPPSPLPARRAVRIRGG